MLSYFTQLFCCCCCFTIASNSAQVASTHFSSTQFIAAASSTTAPHVTLLWYNCGSQRHCHSHVVIASLQLLKKLSVTLAGDCNGWKVLRCSCNCSEPLVWQTRGMWGENWIDISESVRWWRWLWLRPVSDAVGPCGATADIWKRDEYNKMKIIFKFN